jgi:hypothetical protein
LDHCNERPARYKGAAALAAILADPGRYAGRTVVALLSGSNAEPLIWSRLGLLSGHCQKDEKNPRCACIRDT